MEQQDSRKSDQGCHADPGIPNGLGAVLVDVGVDHERQDQFNREQDHGLVAPPFDATAGGIASPM